MRPDDKIQQLRCQMIEDQDGIIKLGDVLVQEQGGVTLTESIPKTARQNLDIQKGDRVTRYLDADEGLIITEIRED
jgi:hypothetical protein